MADSTLDMYGIADLRREVASAACETRADVNRGFDKTNDAIKTTGWMVSDKVSHEADRLAALANQNFIATTDKLFALQKEVLDGKAALVADGAATRELINSVSQQDLRMQVLDARNQAERCIPRCSTRNGNGHD